MYIFAGIKGLIIYKVKNNIQNVMNSQGRTQVFLQKELNKSRTTVYNWYKNISQPSIFDLKRIADLLNVRMEDLILE